MVGGDSLGMNITGAFAIPDFVPGCKGTNPSTGRTNALQYINPDCYIIPVAPSQAFFDAAAPLGCDGNGTAPAQSKYKAYVAAGNSPLTCFNLLGNDPRNAIIGPGLINLDFSMTKDNHIKKISESANLQFRAEFFNITNRVNYAPPVANDLGSLDVDGSVTPGFGALTKTQVPMREIQFALKLIW